MMGIMDILIVRTLCLVVYMYERMASLLCLGLSNLTYNFLCKLCMTNFPKHLLKWMIVNSFERSFCGFAHLTKTVLYNS